MLEKRIAIILTKDEYEVVKKALQTYIKYDAGDMASQILGDIIKIKIWHLKSILMALSNN